MQDPADLARAFVLLRGGAPAFDHVGGLRFCGRPTAGGSGGAESKAAKIVNGLVDD